MTGQPGMPDEAVTGMESVEDGAEGGQPAAPETYFVGGRQQTVEEIVRNYQESTAEAERWKAIAEERAAVVQRQQPAPSQTAEPLPSWGVALTNLGVPEEVIRAQIADLDGRVESRAEAKAAAKMAELVEGLTQISTAEGKADAALSAEIEGYEKSKVDAFLAANDSARARYERVYKADPESAKRLAWAELSNTAGAKGQSRHTGIPAGRRPVLPTKKEDLADLARRASSGTDDKATAAYIKALMGGRSV